MSRALLSYSNFSILVGVSLNNYRIENNSFNEKGLFRKLSIKSSQTNSILVYNYKLIYISSDVNKVFFIIIKWNVFEHVLQSHLISSRSKRTFDESFQFKFAYSTLKQAALHSEAGFHFKNGQKLIIFCQEITFHLISLYLDKDTCSLYVFCRMQKY